LIERRRVRSAFLSDRSNANGDPRVKATWDYDRSTPQVRQVGQSLIRPASIEIIASSEI
jgi:hypothetical protein